MRRWKKGNRYKKKTNKQQLKKQNKTKKKKETEGKESRKLLLIATHRFFRHPLGQRKFSGKS